jgi:hypothetical protein
LGAALRLPRAVAVAALAGFACMGVELTAVRLLAPSFGDSAYVWTNVIGVILLALALGAWVGGRWATRAAGSPLAALLLGAALLTALTGWCGPKLGGWLVPGDLPLDAAMPALVRGSLAASCLLFGPAVWLLGALSPGLVAAVARAGVAVGRAAGAISAAGTAGSLVGTFAATHWLVPTIGCRATLWACALCMAAAALLLRARAGGAATTAGLAAVLGLHLLGGLPLGPLRAAGEGQELIAERESKVQYLQVVRTPAGSQPARTELKINEGLDSFHSVAVEGSVFTGGGYYDYHALAPLLAGDGRRPPGLRALSVGDAAGTFRRIYDAVHPCAVVDAVELDDEVVRLGDQHFAGRRAPGRVFAPLDGRVFVARAREQWHAILVDAYSHQVYVPAHLASGEFFEHVKRCLLPGGVVACNVGGLDAADPVVDAIGRTLAHVFGSARALHIPDSRNMLLVARRDLPLDPAAALAKFEPGGERLSPADAAAFARIVAVASNPRAWTSFAPTDTWLVDDRPELDKLLDASYVAHHDDGVPLRIGGGQDPAAAEAAAYAASKAQDGAAMLAAAARSREATAFLRLLCGDARWRRRELHGAAAEYAAGETLTPAPEIDGQLRERSAALADELRKYDAASAAAARSGVLAAAAVAAFLLATAFAARR